MLTFFQRLIYKNHFSSQKLVFSSQINTMHVKLKVNSKHTYATPVEKKPIPTTDTQHARIENAMRNPFLQWFSGSLYEAIPTAPSTDINVPPTIPTYPIQDKP